MHKVERTLFTQATSKKSNLKKLFYYIYNLYVQRCIKKIETSRTRFKIYKITLKKFNHRQKKFKKINKNFEKK